MRRTLIFLTIILALTFIVAACGNPAGSSITPVPPPPDTPTPTPVLSPTPTAEFIIDPGPYNWAIGEEDILFIWEGELPAYGSEAFLYFVVTDHNKGAPITPIEGLYIDEYTIHTPQAKSVIFIFDGEEVSQSFFEEWFHDPIGDRIEPIVPDCKFITIEKNNFWWHYIWDKVGSSEWLVEYYYSCPPRNGVQASLIEDGAS